MSNVAMINRILEIICECGNTEKYSISSYPFLQVLRKETKDGFISSVKLWDFRTYNTDDTKSEYFVDLKTLDMYEKFVDGIIDKLPGVTKSNWENQQTSHTFKTSGSIQVGYGEINYGSFLVYKSFEKRVEYYANFLMLTELSDDDLLYLHNEIVKKIYNFDVPSCKKKDLYGQIYRNQDYLFRIMELCHEPDEVY